jgi:hypothetical protein
VCVSLEFMAVKMQPVHIKAKDTSNKKVVSNLKKQETKIPTPIKRRSNPKYFKKTFIDQNLG